MSRVKGHALRNEGAPFLVSETGELVRAPSYPSGALGTAGRGRAACECGAMSDLLDSSTKRRNWHREHKAGTSTDHRLTDCECKR